MSRFSRFFEGFKQALNAKRNRKPQKFSEWLQQQGENISVQDALDKYISKYISFEHVDDELLARQKEEIVLLEQVATEYGECMSPEFNDLLFHKKLALKTREDSLQMKSDRKAIIENRNGT